MKHILIIDDDPIVARAYLPKLKSLGYAVSTISDGEGALSCLADSKPDAVLLDLMLPGINGLDVIRQMRSGPKKNWIPIVVLTNAYASQNIQDVLRAGANYCLSKSTCSPQILDRAFQSLFISQPGGKAASTPPDPLAAMPAGTTELAPINYRKQADVLLKEIRTELQLLAKAEEASRSVKLEILYRKVRTIASTGALAGLTGLADVAAALEALLNELCNNPSTASLSVQRTMAATVDLLGLLLQKGSTVSQQLHDSACVLVVDDDPISRRAVKRSLKIVKLSSIEADSAEAALETLKTQLFDLAILDIHLPGMDGLELCRAMRQMPGHDRTPAVFVTSTTDFQTRAKSSLSGGNDFIAKPFVFGELALKALMWVYKSQNALPSGTELKACKIVMLGPDPVMRQACKLCLERQGAKVNVGVNLLDDFYLVQDLKPEILIVGLDATPAPMVALLKKFRAQKQFQKMKIVILTEKPGKETVAMLKEINPAAIQDTKTMTPITVLELLRGLISP